MTRTQHSKLTRHSPLREPEGPVRFLGPRSTTASAWLLPALCPAEEGLQKPGNDFRHAVFIVLLLGAVSAACSQCGRVDQVEPAAAPSRASAPAVPATARTPNEKASHSERATREGCPSLLGRIKALRGGASYEAPTSEALVAYADRLGAAITSSRQGQKPPGLTIDGFVFEECSAAEGALTLFVEAPERRRGAGVVVLRSKALVPLVIEAPHSFFDTHTLRLAVEARGFPAQGQHLRCTVSIGVASCFLRW